MAVNCSQMGVALGANLVSTVGPPYETLSRALERFEGEGLLIRSISKFYETPCFPAGAGPDYVNAAVLCETELSPFEALAALHRIEAHFGRLRSTRWAGRSLDLDLLFFDQKVLPDVQTHKNWVELPMIEQESETPDQLLLPHPRLQDRAFVLIPLADIAPGWSHPVSRLTVAQMLEALPSGDTEQVVAL